MSKQAAVSVRVGGNALAIGQKIHAALAAKYQAEGAVEDLTNIDPEVLDQAVVGRDLVFETGRYTRQLVDFEAKDGGRFADALDLEEGEWPGLVRELFGRLKGTMCTRMDTPAANADWASALHDTADSLGEWQTAVDTADGDTFLAGVGAAVIAEHLADALDDDPHATPRLR